MQEDEMREQSLEALRDDPRPEFAESLRARLRAEDMALDARPRRSARRAAMAAAAVAVVVIACTVPGVRASAQSFLSLFRMTNLVVVPVDAGRLDALNASDLSPEQLIGGHVQIVEDPGQPTDVASVDQAAALAGMTLRVPQWLPDDTRIVETAVTREGLVRVTGDTARLQDVMNVLGIRDLHPPQALDGQIVTVRVPPVAMIRYEHGKRHTRLFQARPPEIGLPGGVDLAALGEIGLRMLGLDAQEARTFAQEIDWHTTLLLPLPPTMSRMQRVSIAGHDGVEVDFQPPNEAFTRMVLWSTGDRVFALASVQERNDLLAMANSIR
jgi:hypothetical protein